MSRFCPLPENVLGCQDGAVLGGLVCKGWACCSTSYDVQTVLQNKELLSPRHKWRWGSATARAQVSTRRTLVTFCHSARQVCCAAVTDASEVPGHKCEWTSRGERSTGPGQQELSLLIPWNHEDLATRSFCPLSTALSYSVSEMTSNKNINLTKRKR